MKARWRVKLPLYQNLIDLNERLDIRVIGNISHDLCAVLRHGGGELLRAVDAYSRDADMRKRSVGGRG